VARNRAADDARGRPGDDRKLHGTQENEGKEPIAQACVRRGVAKESRELRRSPPDAGRVYNPRPYCKAARDEDGTDLARSCAARAPAFTNNNDVASSTGSSSSSTGCGGDEDARKTLGNRS
jgi:hypothetical protein